MLRTLTYYWPIHLAVILGAAVATAVLSGALFVGDSVRGSLRELTLDRLGGIEAALLSDSFFRESLAERLEGAAPAVVLRGSATHADSGARASRVGIHGVDDRFAAVFGGAASLDLGRKDGQRFPSVVVNRALQRELDAEIGDAVLLSFGRFSHVPRESLMGERDLDGLIGSLRLTVIGILPDSGLGRFGLQPSQQQPLNAFVDLRRLQRSLDLRGSVNSIFTARPAAEADGALRAGLQLEDLGLTLDPAGDHFTVESREYVLRPDIDERIGTVAAELGAPALRIQSYLANRIETGGRELPYAMLAAFDPLSDSPWGSLGLVDGTPVSRIGANGILLNAWAAGELEAAVGDSVDLTYFVVGPREELREETWSLRVEGIVPMRGLGADRSLTPDYPGIQEADDVSDWDPPFPVELDRIGERDEAYWDEFGAAPRAFVSGETGRRLWSTRFGSTSAIRIGAAPGEDLEQTRAEFRRRLREQLAPAASGFVFRPVKREGLEAATGATDFAGLFLAFSFFLIISAGLLVGLLFRLGVEQRAGEIGLLLAVGHPVRGVRRGLLVEGGLLAMIGGLVGLAGGLGYAWLLMAGLRTLWRPAVGSSELFLHVRPGSPAIGWGIAVVVVLLSVALALRTLVRIAPPRLLAGAVGREGRPGRGRLTAVLAFGGLLFGLTLMLISWFRGPAPSVGLAFGTGALLLVAGLALFARWCRATRRRPLVPGTAALIGMAARNSSWNPGRSILSLSLMASACFVIVLVATHHTVPGAGLDARDSGSGGFGLLAEAEVALHQDLNRHEGRLDLGFSEEESHRLDRAEVYPLRLLPGDDASCLNLYQPEQPRLLGVPPELVERGGFRFQQTLELPEGAGSPWELLDQPLEAGVIPAIGDANSVLWILHLGLGKELTIENEFGEPLRLRLVGLLQGSVFQSELLIAERDFLEHFPGRTGASYFLIDTPAAEAQAVAPLLEATLAPFGFDATTTRDKIIGYKTVENTYLSTFQVLGGLGLLLGTVGLGVVLARNVIERRGELATLRAFGFRRSRLAWLVLMENAFLLVVGVTIGTGAALAASGPRLAELHLPWLSLLGTLALVLVVGMLSSVAAVAGALRVPLLATLKAER